MGRPVLFSTLPFCNVLLALRWQNAFKHSSRHSSLHIQYYSTSISLTLLDRNSSLALYLEIQRQKLSPEIVTIRQGYTASNDRPYWMTKWKACCGRQLWPESRSKSAFDMIYDTMIWNDVIWYMLTEIGLTPGGSSTLHIYTLTVHRKTQWNRIHRTEHNNNKNT
jgi:hypothetical protein